VLTSNGLNAGPTPSSYSSDAAFTSSANNSSSGNGDYRPQATNYTAQARNMHNAHSSSHGSSHDRYQHHEEMRYQHTEAYPSTLSPTEAYTSHAYPQSKSPPLTNSPHLSALGSSFLASAKNVSHELAPAPSRMEPERALSPHSSFGSFSGFGGAPRLIIQDALQTGPRSEADRYQLPSLSSLGQGSLRIIDD
jgi:hypothetical protein